MAAKPCDWSIIPEQTRIHMAWGTFVWSFPSICPAVLEKKIFYRFQGKSKMAAKPCNVTDAVTCVNVLFLMERRNTCKVLPQSVQPLQRRRFFELTRVIILHIKKIMKFPIYRKVFYFITEPGRQASGAMKVVVTCNSLYYGLWEATMLKNKSCLCFVDFSMESVTIQPIPPNHSSLFFTQQTLLSHRRSSKIPSATRDCWRMCVFHWKVSVTHGICLIICTGDLRHFLNNRRILMTEEQVRPIIRQVSWADVDGIRYLWCLSCGLKTGYFKWIRFFWKLLFV